MAERIVRAVHGFGDQTAQTFLALRCEALFDDASTVQKVHATQSALFGLRQSGALSQVRDERAPIGQTCAHTHACAQKVHGLTPLCVGGEALRFG